MIQNAFVLITVSVGLCATPLLAEDDPPKRVRVYFIGNSVTDTINYTGLTQLAESRGHQLVWGRHVIPGAPLQWIWEHPKDGFQQPPFGYYPHALSEHTWDAICLQPFDRHMVGAKGDIAMCRNFILAARKSSPNMQVLIYARWPRKEKNGSLDYAARWKDKYTGDWDGTNESRDYFERLTRELQAACPELQRTVRIIPVGHVMSELDRRMQAGEVPGFAAIGEVYRDGIHLKNVGKYIVGCTFYAVLMGESPVGLPTQPYDVNDATVAKIIQSTVWEVVTEHPLAQASSPASDRKVRAPALDASRESSPTEEQLRRRIVGVWTDNYQGTRTMTLQANGAGTIVAELEGMKAMLFAPRLRFDLRWRIEEGRLHKRVTGGEPGVRVNMILKTMGDRTDESILELTDRRLRLLDKDGQTEYNWRRKGPTPKPR